MLLAAKEEIKFNDNDLDLFAELARSDFSFFPQLVSGNKNPKHIDYIAKKIQNAVESPETDKHKLLIISIPPRHGKTQLISIHLPPWIAGNYPKKRIIMSSYGAELAETNSNAAKNIFEYWGPILWNVNPGEIFKRSAWNTEEIGGVVASGVGGATTGFGADLYILDDFCKDNEEASSTLKREKIWNWFQSVVATRLHPGALLIIFATRWDDDDLIGRLLKQQKEEKEDFPFATEVINLPALAEENDPLGRAAGDALWELRFTRKKLLNIKKILGPYWWAALYEGDPTPRGGTLFKSQYFRYWSVDTRTGDYLCYRQNEEYPVRVRKNELIRHVYVDPAIEIKKKNDPTGMLAWGYSKKHRVWLLLDRINDRIEHTEVLATIKNFALKNSCILAGIENEKLGKVLVKQSAGNDKIGGVKIPFKEIPTKGLDKYARAVPMATYTQNERVFFPKNAQWLTQYEGCLIRFPLGGHDEDIDCTAMAQHMENKMSITEALRGRG